MSGDEEVQIEEGRKTLGQRRINLIWEATQSVIALGVTFSTLYVSSVMVLRGGDKTDAVVLLLSNSFFLVVGFYFGRTNHQKIGGVGRSDDGR